MTPEQKVLMKAAKLIERYGWVQGCFGNERMGFCMHGAIDKASPKDDSSPVLDRLNNFLGVKNFSRINDHEYTDPTQAICALTGAAMMEI